MYLAVNYCKQYTEYLAEHVFTETVQLLFLENILANV